MNNIKNTLKKRLFYNIGKNETSTVYKSLQYFIFPNKEDYINFLEETNYENTVRYAKKIILRLGFVSYFPPPTRLSFNVLELGDREIEDDFTGFISRDHFVHLVHLYILGIYMFNYHDAFRKAILNNFIFSRKTQKKDIQVKESSYRDFIICWRYFVLYHDIGYPFEKFVGFENFRKETKLKYLLPFQRIQKSISKDLSLKVLSKLVSIYQLLTTSRKDKVFHKYTGIDKSTTAIKDKNDKSLDSSILDKLNDFVLADKIFNYKTFNYLLNIFPKEYFTLVLFDENMTAEIIYVKTEGKDDYEPYMIEGNTTKSKAKQFIEGKWEPLNCDWQKLKNRSIHLFISNDYKDEFSKYLDIIFEGNCDMDSFIGIQKFLTNKSDSQIVAVTNDEELEDYIFGIFLNCYDAAGYIKEENENVLNEIFFENAEREFRDLVQKLPDLIGEKLVDIIKGNWKNTQIRESLKRNELSDSIKEILTSIDKGSSAKFEVLSNSISKKIERESSIRINSFNSFIKSKDLIKDQLEESSINSKLSYDVDNDKFEYGDLSHYKLIKEIDKKLNINGLKNIEDLLKYKPKYAGKNSDFIDHGIGSGMVFMDSIDLYNSFVEKLDSKDVKSNLIRLAIGLDFDFNPNYIKFKFKHELAEVGYAIFIHNIYPEYHHSNPDFKTKLENEPFAYFSLLCDALQPWDRKFNTSQALGQLPYATYGDKFNIEILKGKILISEYGSNLNLSARLNSLKTSLNKYLENASSYIKLNLSTWKI